MSEWDDEAMPSGPTDVDTDVGTGVGAMGSLMLDAGYAVSDISHVLHEATRARGRRDVVIGALPSAVLVDDRAAGRTLISHGTGSQLTFDQIARTGRLVGEVTRGEVPWRSVHDRIAAVRAQPPLFPVWVAVLGSGLQSGGVSVVFGVPWWSVILSGLLGMLVGVGLIAVTKFVRVAQLVPFFAAFLVTVLTWWAAEFLGAGSVPLFAVCAPIVVLIPGAIVTNAVIELSAGDVVSGGGRLISGLLVWALLATGIAAGMGVVGGRLEGASIVGAVHEGADGLGAWGEPAPGWLVWPAIAVVGAGVGFFCSAGRRMTLVITGMLLSSYAIIVLCRQWMPMSAAVGISAAVCLPLTRLIETLQPDWPSIAVFRPVFWMLVPGSFGLVAVTTAGGAGDVAAMTIETVLALTIGTQVGAVVAESVESVVRRRRRAPVWGVPVRTRRPARRS